MRASCASALAISTICCCADAELAHQRLRRDVVLEPPHQRPRLRALPPPVDVDAGARMLAAR